MELSVCYRNGICIGGCVDIWFGLKCDMKCLIDNCVWCMLLFFGVLCDVCENGYYLYNEGECKICFLKCVICVSELKCI